ncbi:Formyl-CoA:oxalate CoA-transferase [compost metagenome]
MLEDGSLTPVAHMDARQTGLSDTHRLYRCSDAWLVVVALQLDEVQRFRALTSGQPQAYFAGLTREAALAALATERVLAQPVLEAQMDAFLDSPENAAAGLHAHYNHAVYGDLQQIGVFWDFGNLPLSLRRPPPALGQHTRQVLESLGFAGSELERLAAAGLVAL